MKTDTLTESLAAVEIVKNTVASLRAQRVALVAEEIALTQKKQELKAQPGPIEDVKQALMDYIDARAAIFLDDGQWERNIRKFLYPNRDSYVTRTKVAPLTYDQAVELSSGDASNKLFTVEHPKLVIPDIGLFDVTDAPLLFFFGDLIKAKICAYFDSVPINHDPSDVSLIGTPMAERAQEINRINKRLFELHKQRDELDRHISSLIVNEEKPCHN